MRPYTVASIYASVAVGFVAFCAGTEALERSQRGYQLQQSFLLEVGASIGFYFILVFVLVAKFPRWSTRVLLGTRNTFKLSGLRTPVQRMSFIAMCVGMFGLTVTSIAYYFNGHEELFEYWLGGRRLAPSGYRTWLWVALVTSVFGLLGSFLYGTVLQPLMQWLKGNRPPSDDQ